MAKLVEQGITNYNDISEEILSVLKSKRDEIVFKMKLTSKDETDILSKRIEKLEKKLKPCKKQKENLNRQRNLNLKTTNL